MGVDLIIVLCVLAVAGVLFVTEWIPLDVTALGILAVLLATGVLSPEQGLSGFSSPATITIAALLVLAAGLEHTGAIAWASELLARLGKRNEPMALAALLAVTGVLSAFVNNTAVVALFIPMVVGLSRRIGRSPSKMLMPLSFAAMLGGVCTLVGTSTNLVVSSIAVDHGQPAIGMFEPAPVGLVLFALGYAYLVFANRLVPARREVADLAGTFQVDRRISELALGDASKASGRSLADGLLDGLDTEVLAVIRDGSPVSDARGTPLRPGDVVRVAGSRSEVDRLALTADLDATEERTWHDEDFGDDELLAEAVVSPESGAPGRTVDEWGFEERFGGTAIAVSHGGELMRDHVVDQPLRKGDAVLLRVTRDRVTDVARDGVMVLVSETGEEATPSARAPLAALILAAAVATAAVGIAPIVVTAVVGCVVMLLTRCLTPEQAYQAVHWRVILLLAAVIPLGTAMDESGAAALLASWLETSLGPLGPHATIVALFLVTLALTNVMSNVAAAALLAPVALQAATAIGVDGRPLIMAVCYGASLSFLTPIGYQTNTLVHGPGQYHSTDFLRVGGPLSLICAVVVAFGVPWIWPL